MMIDSLLPAAFDRLDCKALARAYATGRIDPRTVIDTCLARIEAYNPRYNAFCVTAAPASARRAAGESRKRWLAGTPLSPIDGIPVTLKDWYDVKGWPTRQGSKTTSPASRTQDSFLAASLRRMGAILLGKTTLPEFGHKGVTHSPLHGITRNPWNTDRTSGGSSGGAAVAAATGMGLLHIGSDAAGSVRIPAAFCGVVGFKPSPGLMPSWPPSLFSSLSSIGPLTRSVADAALLARLLANAAAQNPEDANAVDPALAARAFAKPRPGRPLRIALCDKIGAYRLTPGAQNLWNRQKKHLSVLGTVETVRLEIDTLAETFAGHWTAVAGFMASGLGPGARKKLDPRFLYWVEAGEKQHLHDYLRAEYDRLLIAGIFKKLFGRYDLLVTPTTPFSAFAVGIDMPDDPATGRPVENWNIFNAFANLARLPALSLPLGLDAEGLPCGLQICAAPYRDGLVLSAAARLEKQIAFTPWLARRDG